MTKRTALLAALVVAAGLAAGGARVEAGMNGSRLTYLTFSGPVALPGVTLGAGTYAFELADPLTAANVVLVRNHTRTRTYFLGFTQRVPRPASVSSISAITFGEAPSGEPRPIAVWYPPDSTDGLEFIYRR